MEHIHRGMTRQIPRRQTGRATVGATARRYHAATVISIAPIAFPVLLLFGYLSALLMVVHALASHLPGRRVGPFLVVPLVVAIGLTVVLVVLFAGESGRLLSRFAGGGLASGEFRLPPSATYIAIGAAFLIAVAVVHFGASEIPGWAVRRVQRQSAATAEDSDGGATVADVLRAVLLGGAGVAIVGTSFVFGQTAAATTRQGQGAAVVEEFPLDGGPTGLVITEDHASAYVTLGDGRIVRMELDQDGLPGTNVEVVAEGLSFPRGPAIVDGELFVADLGTLACPDPFPQCWTPEPAEELDRINASSASVLAFEIQTDGSLGEPREVLTDLPVVNTEHAPNSITLGPDGYLYMPIAGPDRLPLDLALAEDITHPNADLLGTIVRFLPAGGDVEVIASGIRNIYSLTFDPDGHLYGVDNDGQTGRGWRHEQLIEVVDGADYGYPAHGTFDGTSTQEPLWILDTIGSTGTDWSAVDGATGVLVGSASRLDLVRLDFDGDGPYVADERSAVTMLQGLNGFVTGIEAVGDGRYLMSVLRFEGQNALLVVDIGE